MFDSLPHSDRLLGDDAKAVRSTGKVTTAFLALANVAIFIAAAAHVRLRCESCYCVKLLLLRVIRLMRRATVLASGEGEDWWLW